MIYCDHYIKDPHRRSVQGGHWSIRCTLVKDHQGDHENGSHMWKRNVRKGALIAPSRNPKMDDILARLNERF